MGVPFIHVLSGLGVERFLRWAPQLSELKCVVGLAQLPTSGRAVRPIFSAPPAWNTRMVQRWPHDHVIVVDRNEMFIFNDRGRYHTMLRRSARMDDVDRYVATVELAWAEAHNNRIYESPTTDVNSTALDVVSSTEWDRVIKTMAQNPDLMRAMPPRSFEELVAELLDRQGLAVTLTPSSKDNGRDILARLATPLGEYLYLVECKRYAADRLIGVELVRQLYGVVEVEKANAGVLVTTSSFTAGARQLQRTIGNRISLRDYMDLVGWLQGDRPHHAA